jgi:hypothetical protein
MHAPGEKENERTFRYDFHLLVHIGKPGGWVTGYRVCHKHIGFT